MLIEARKKRVTCSTNGSFKKNNCSLQELSNDLHIRKTDNQRTASEK